MRDSQRLPDMTDGGRLSASGRARGSEPEVRDLESHEFRDAAAVLARGMRDNPLHIAAYGMDPQRRLRCHRRLVSGLFRVSPGQRPVCVERAGRVIAVAGVAPVGTCRPTLPQRLGVLPNVIACGPMTAARVGTWISAWTRRDPSDPHVHLGPLAVDAGLQGQGIGSLLMREICRRLDADRSTGYLETDKQENVRFYERFGFRVVGEAAVLRVPNWFMRRSPAEYANRWHQHHQPQPQLS